MEAQEGACVLPGRPGPLGCLCHSVAHDTFPSSIYYVMSWMVGFFGLAILMTGLIFTKVKTEVRKFTLPMLMAVFGIYVMLFGIFLVITLVMFWYGVALSLGGLFLMVAGVLLQVKV